MGQALAKGPSFISWTRPGFTVSPGQGVVGRSPRRLPTGLGAPESPALGSSLPDLCRLWQAAPAQLPPAPSVVPGREFILPSGRRVSQAAGDVEKPRASGSRLACADWASASAPLWTVG